MNRNQTHHRGRTVFVWFAMCLALAGLAVRLGFLMIDQAEYYGEMANEIHLRERRIKAPRGRILDRNGVVLADSRTVCTVSVIHSQVTDPERVISVLQEELGIPEEEIRKKVEKNSSREIIRTNVEKEQGDAIRLKRLNGVKVDEDSRRTYPFDNLASRVLGFTGGDNQGIIGLEVQYESHLRGRDGRILTLTDAVGREIENAAEQRLEPVPGRDLVTALDVNIQMYAQQEAVRVREQKQAQQVSVLVMNPKTGEILAMANVPEFSLSHPFDLPEETEADRGMSRQERLNRMWRNPAISDTYEPGSTFKIITAAAGLEEGAVRRDDPFFCPGYRVVEDRKIRCHKTGGHGAETFLTGMMNSCNPVLIEVGQRLGPETFLRYFRQFGLDEKTGADLPGEASAIMHRAENLGPVELATVSFGQSFQITPLQLASAVSSLINGGTRVVPHVAAEGEDAERKPGRRILSEETSKELRFILEQVVAKGSGKKAAIDGYRIGGKTATSQKLPRSSRKYIASFLGFAPADDPQVLALVVIDEPCGTYYGGQIAAPVVRDLFENILPYLGIRREDAPG